MKFLVHIMIPVDAGNDVIREGRLGDLLQRIFEEQKPEAVYFATSGGDRTIYMFLDLEDASRIPAIAEPWFLALEANVEFHPVLGREEMERALPGIEKAVEAYG